MSYSILSSNVVMGTGTTPQYSFVTTDTGTIQLTCLDSAVVTPTLQINGVVSCETVALGLASDRVVATDIYGLSLIHI